MAKTSFTRAMLNELVAQNDRALNDRKVISVTNYQFRKILVTLNLRIEELERQIESIWDDYVEYIINQQERDQLISIYQQQIDELSLIVNTINPAQ